jgi:hypothetical protein
LAGAAGRNWFTKKQQKQTFQFFPPMILSNCLSPPFVACWTWLGWSVLGESGWPRT